MTANADVAAHTDGQVPTWRLIWRVATYRPALSAGTLAALVVSNGLLLALGLLLQRIFDALTGHTPAGLGVYGPIAVLVAVELTRIGAAWGSGMLWVATWEHMGGLLRVNLLRAQLQSGGPEAGTLHASPGEAVSRFRDDIQDVLYFLDTALWVAGRALFALGSVTVMLRIDPLVTVAVALPLAARVVRARPSSARAPASRATAIACSQSLTARLRSRCSSSSSRPWAARARACSAEGGTAGITAIACSSAAMAAAWSPRSWW
jgi:ATP-binding cassette, subfamily B, bacterial